MKISVRKITGIAMVAAIAFVVMLAGFHFMSAAPFLKYEAKDVILTMGGFIYGPVGAMAAAALVAFIEMVTVSETGIVGFWMNFLAASSFAGVASLIYRKKRTVGGAGLGLFCGTASLTIMMLVWNYLITPSYMKVPREVVVSMLLPVFLPFNLIKGGLNSAFILLIYKPLTTALKSSRLLYVENAPAPSPGAAASGATTSPSASPGAPAQSQPAPFKFNAVILACAAVLLIACGIAIYFVRK